MTYREQTKAVKTAGDQLVEEFGQIFKHVNRSGSLFRLDRSGSFWHNGPQLCLQVQREPGGPWLDFTRGTLADFRPYLRREA